jgi:Uma2 family endonuclease
MTDSALLELEPDAETDRDELTRAELRALWNRLAEDPASPERYELTEHGELIVSPLPSNRHQAVIVAVSEQLKAQLGGLVIPSVSVLTSSGVRVPDIAWLPEARRHEPLRENPLERCPPLVVEVLSPGNRPFEVNHKTKAYLTAGAEEVVVVTTKGRVSYRRADGVHSTSALGVVLNLAPELFAA